MRSEVMRAPTFVRAHFDAGFRNGDAGAGVMVEAANEIMHETGQPRWQVVWCSCIKIDTDNAASSSLSAELLGATEAIAAIISFLCIGYVTVNATGHVQLPVMLRNFLPFDGTDPKEEKLV